MGLRKLAAILLPRDYREQVLGDLHERGFHVADIVSVLPQVWWSSVRRSFSVPNLAGASEEVICRRTKRMEVLRFAWAVFWLTIFGASTCLDPHRPGIERLVSGLFVFIPLAAILMRMFRQPAQHTRPAMERHRGLVFELQRGARFGTFYFFAVFATKRFIHAFVSESTPGGLFPLGLVACFVYGQFRAHRLQREIQCLR